MIKPLVEQSIDVTFPFTSEIPDSEIMEIEEVKDLDRST